jgi:hypothetical protein
MSRKKPKIMLNKEQLTVLFDEIINEFIKWKDGGWEGVRFICPADYESQEVEFYLTAKRPETDKEYEARMKVEEQCRQWEKNRKLKREEDQRKLYEQLKNKFEK